MARPSLRCADPTFSKRSGGWKKKKGLFRERKNDSSSSPLKRKESISVWGGFYWIRAGNCPWSLTQPLTLQKIQHSLLLTSGDKKKKNGKTMFYINVVGDLLRFPSSLKLFIDNCKPLGPNSAIYLSMNPTNVTNLNICGNIQFKKTPRI